MLITETVGVALDALRVNKLRSLLTMLGIVIGVAAVIAMVALGRGAQDAVNANIASLGTTLLNVSPGQVFTGGIASQTDRARLYAEDADALRTQGKYIAAVEPEMSRNLQVQYLGSNTNTRVIGTTDNYLQVRKYKMQVGDMFTQADDDGRRRVAVLGATVVANLGSSPSQIMNKNIRIGGTPFTVVGVLAPKGGASGFGDPDDQLIIPLGTARFRVLDTRYLNTIGVLAPNEQMITKTMSDITRVLRRAHKIPPGRPDDFRIFNQADFLNAFSASTATFTFLLAGVATVSLLVGGIGIMNIMLVSVTERTREIGVRKALGATRSNILLQFLIESVVLSVLGGAIGVALGAGSAMLMRQLAHFNTSVAPESILLAFVFSAAVGIVFGVWPARRAAALDPIVSLRYE
jgi:putative ABC transport system permease protein